ncbi:MAG: mechanosensitive ion channel [Lewinellaceae bacterium]|nr:mechanosensitive ion channel [Lewinellaceae bacterium]
MTNYWNQLILNLPNYLAAIIVFVLGFILSRQVYKLSYQLINRYSKDLLVANFLAKSIRIIFLLLILILSLNLAGWGDVAKNLFAAAGLSAVVLGFAFKDIGENFISGVMLSFDRPFDLDDTIMVGDIFGKVKLMELRYTKLKPLMVEMSIFPIVTLSKKPFITTLKITIIVLIL